ncbi:hypothetical protein Tco_1155975 [Tanacetum coccineum]
MLNNQKSSSCKIDLGFDNGKASKSGTKPISFVGSSIENATDRSTIPGSVDPATDRSTIPGSVNPPSMLQTHDGKYKSILNLQSIRWRKIQNQLGSSIVAIRMDHGWEFDNEVQFGAFCDAQGISHNFSAPLEESLNVTLNENPPPTKLSPLVDDDIGEEEAIENNIKVVNNNNIED